MNIAVVGCGRLGLTTAVTLALMNHKVIGVDIDQTKVDELNNKKTILCERGLSEALKQTVESGNLKFTTELSQAIKTCDYLFVTVPAPIKPNGEYNLDHVAEVVKSIDQLSPAKQKIIIIRSTVPIGTCEELRTILDNKQHVIVHNPEFFREGNVLEDSLNPDRVIFGLPNFIPKLAILFINLTTVGFLMSSVLGLAANSKTAIFFPRVFFLSFRKLAL